MAIFDANIQNQLKEILKSMNDEVKLVFFTQEIECPMCRETGLFVDEIVSLSDKLSVEKYNFIQDREIAQKYGVDKIPAIVLLDKDDKDYGVKFYGLPGGYEINSFLGAIIEISGKREELPGDIISRIKKIDKDVHIQVFVGLGCPHCPGAVAIAHRLAMENEKIKGDMIDAGNFIPLSLKFNVTGVPKIILNDKYELTGAQPMAVFLDAIENLE